MLIKNHSFSIFTSLCFLCINYKLISTFFNRKKKDPLSSLKHISLYLLLQFYFHIGNTTS